VDGKPHLLFALLKPLEHPEELVKHVVYPWETLQDVVKEYKSNGPTYQQQARHASIHALLPTHGATNSGHFRVSLQQRYPPSGDFSSRVCKKYQGSTQHYHYLTNFFINGVLKSGWRT